MNISKLSFNLFVNNFGAPKNTEARFGTAFLERSPSADTVSFEGQKKAKLPKEPVENIANSDDKKDIKDKKRFYAEVTGLAKSLSSAWEAQMTDFKNQIGNIFSALENEGALRVEYRSKSESSTREKLISGNEDSGFRPITGGKNIENAIGDALGARVVLKNGSTADLVKVYDALKSALEKDQKKGRKIIITEFESYRPEPSLSFFDVGKIKHNAFEHFIKKTYSNDLKKFCTSVKPSGYMAVHINGLIQVNDSRSRDIAPVMSPFEIQITSENVLRIAKTEAYARKALQGKKLSVPVSCEKTLFSAKIQGLSSTAIQGQTTDREFLPLLEAASKLTEEEKNLYAQYRHSCFVNQRKKDLFPRDYAGERFLDLPYKGPNWVKALDLNEVESAMHCAESRKQKELERKIAKRSKGPRVGNNDE